MRAFVSACTQTLLPQCFGGCIYSCTYSPSIGFALHKPDSVKVVTKMALILKLLPKRNRTERKEKEIFIAIPKYVKVEMEPDL